MKDIQILSKPTVAKEVSGLELLPCPFCGMAEPFSETARTYGKSDWRSKMHCTACGASSGWSAPMGHDDSANAAIEIWNMRLNSASQPLQSKKSDDRPRLVPNVVPN
jgi:Lar family restriction alleviation protein